MPSRSSPLQINFLFLIIIFSISLVVAKTLKRKETPSDILLQRANPASFNNQPIDQQCNNDNCECKSTRTIILEYQYTTNNGNLVTCKTSSCDGKWKLIKTACCGNAKSKKKAKDNKCVECGSVCGVYQCDSNKKKINVAIPWKC